MLELLSLPFMQRAILAALVSGLLSPAVGTYIVQRRLSLLGDGLGHVAIAGVGLAILTGNQPLPVAVAVAVAGAVLVELLRQNGWASGDVGLAMLFYGGLAAGVLMAGLGGQGAGALSQYLFGSLTTVSSSDILIILGLAVLVIVPAVGLSPQLFCVCADEQYAHTQGLPVRALNLLIVVLAAVTVTMSMRTVGLLLVSAMMVVPVATAQNLFIGFRSTLVGSMLIGMTVAVGGTVTSGWLDTASGATIVVGAILIFMLSWPVSKALQHRRHAAHRTGDHAPASPAVAVRAPQEPGGEAVLHDDHVDYLDEGSRHCPRGLPVPERAAVRVGDD